MKRVLHIEDNLDILEVTALMLQDAGFESVAATDHAEAMGHVTSSKFDVIILDLSVIKDTKAFIDAIRPNETPVVICSAAAECSPIYNTVLTYTVKKPFEAEHLIAVVNQACASRRI